MSRARFRLLFLFLAVTVAGCSCAFAQAPTPLGAELPLRAGWQLQSSCQTQATATEISSADFHATRWHTTKVPSTVLAALVADGTYPSPDYGLNLRKIPGTTYPIGANFANLAMPKDSPFACSWWYRTEFLVPKDFAGRQIWLHFSGINYRANIWINGKKFADAKDVAGSYRIYDFNVTQFLQPGRKNALAVETFAPSQNDLAMNFVDWNPAPPDKDMGLWGDVYLESSGAVSLRHLMVATHFPDASLDEADLTVRVQVRNSSQQPINAEVKGEIASVSFAQTVSLAPGETQDVDFAPSQYAQLRIAHPKIWWPYGLGPQNLHTLTMTASIAGEISDEQQTRFGVREITSQLDAHNSRLFRINGKRILIRGGGWAPDMLLRDSPERLEAQFDYVREMGLNTIRLEGKLAPEDFFNLADQRGVLVMAGWCCCSFWERWRLWKPSDLEIATAQLRSQILRLRSHPGLLVWLNGSDNPPPAPVERAYIQVLHDSDWPNPFISSASQEPTSVTGPSGVKMTGPYEYVSPSYWLEETGKHGGAWGFNTETSPGPAPMVAGSLRKTMPPGDIWPPNEYWRFHSGSGDFQKLSVFDDAMTAIYGPPKNLADYEAKAQAMTYEGERAMFEAYARNKYDSTGVIQWMLNNAWPSFYWHLYDYYLQPAGGYFGAKKANEMLHVQYSYDDRSVVVENSHYQEVPNLSLTAQVYDFNLKPIFSRRVEVNSAENSSQKVLTIPPFPATQDPHVYFVKLTLENHAGEVVSRNFYWLSSKPAVFEWYWTTYVRTEEFSYEDCRQLEQLPPVKLETVASREIVDGQTEVRVRLQNPSSHLAFQVRLAVKNKNGDEILPVFWDDNYLELMPGEARTITARYPSWIQLGDGAQLEVSGWNITATEIPLSSQPAGARK